MFAFYLYLVFQAFLLAYLTIYYLINSLIIEYDLIDWATVLMSKKMELFVIFLILQVIFLSLHPVIRYAINILKYKNKRESSFDYWKALSLLIIIIDIYLYLVLKIGWLFIIPFLIYWLIKEIIVPRPR